MSQMQKRRHNVAKNKKKERLSTIATPGRNMIGVHVENQGIINNLKKVIF